jgi:hypothetical protein
MNNKRKKTKTKTKKSKNSAGLWWLTSEILSSQKAEIWRIKVQSPPGETVHETLSRNDPSQKRTGRVAQGVGPEFKPHTTKKKKKK